MALINKSNLSSNYFTKINNLGNSIDIFNIFAFNSDYATTPAPITPSGYYVQISGISYDLLQLFIPYSSYLINPPFITNFNVIISGITYDISQIFIFYPISIGSGDFTNLVYYNGYSSGQIKYYIQFSSPTSVYDFNPYINSSGNLTGYIIGGGGGGSSGSINSNDTKGGSGGGGGGTFFINVSLNTSSNVSVTIGSGGVGGIISPASLASNGSNSTISINGTTHIAGGGYGGSGTYYSNNPNPNNPIPYSNGGAYPGQTIGSGLGGYSGNGRDNSGSDTGTPPGGGGGGVSTNGFNLNYTVQDGSNGTNGTNETISTGGVYNGGAGGEKSILPINGVSGGGGGGGSGVSSDRTYPAQNGANGGNGIGLLIFSFSA